MYYKHKDTSYNGILNYLDSKGMKCDYNTIAKLTYGFLKEHNLKPAKGKSYRAVFGNSMKVQKHWKLFTKYIKSKNEFENA